MTRSKRAERRSSIRQCGIQWTDRALQDLADIEDYIGLDNPDAAVRWVDKLVEAAQRAALLPQAGRIVPEKGQAEVREVLLKTYRIVYLVLEDRIDVLTVFEGHHLFPL